MGKVFADMVVVFRNFRFISFLVIFSGFWIMFWQIFYSLPFYVRDVLHFGRFEIIETVDAWTIILVSPGRGVDEEGPADHGDDPRVRDRQRLVAGHRLDRVDPADGRRHRLLRGGRGDAGAALLRIRRRSRAARPGRNLHGLRLPAGGHRRGCGRAALRLAGADLPEARGAIPAACGFSCPRSASRRRRACSSTTASSRRGRPRPDGGEPACSRFSRCSSRSPLSASRRGCASASCGWRTKSPRCARGGKKRDFL